jgi:predicted ATP-grasp superfamily ATP-dependent carboligase
VDIRLQENHSLAEVLQQIVENKREEIGSHQVVVQEVIPTGENKYTVILNMVLASY